MSLGALLKKARADRGLSQQQVADAADISKSLYVSYEGDRNTPSVDKMARVCAVLDLDPRDVFAEALEPGSRTTKAEPDDYNSVLRRQVTELARKLGLEISDKGSSVEDPTTAEGLTAQLAPTPENAKMALEEIRELVSAKGLRARRLPGLVKSADEILHGLDFVDLRGIADEVGIDLSSCGADDEEAGALFPSFFRWEDRKSGFLWEEDPEELDEADAHEQGCAGAAHLILAHAVYGDALLELTVEQFADLHGRAAKALGKPTPLVDDRGRRVPTKGEYLSWLGSSESDREALQTRYLWTLPHHMVLAIEAGKAVKLPAIEAEE